MIVMPDIVLALIVIASGVTLSFFPNVAISTLSFSRKKADDINKNLLTSVRVIALFAAGAWAWYLLTL